VPVRVNSHIALPGCFVPVLDRSMAQEKAAIL
jgi:hypothetical protein